MNIWRKGTQKKKEGIVKVNLRRGLMITYRKRKMVNKRKTLIRDQNIYYLKARKRKEKENNLKVCGLMWRQRRTYCKIKAGKEKDIMKQDSMCGVKKK